MGIELFERAVGGGGQLLKAEIRPLRGRSDRVGLLLLTFDLGRIAVGVEPATSSLTVSYVASPDETPPGLEDAVEEDPWWRIVGSPLARVWKPDAAGGAICLQFRGDDQSPRIVTLEPHGGSVEIRLENSPASV
jgi:hypothetical protein